MWSILEMRRNDLHTGDAKYLHEGGGGGGGGGGDDFELRCDGASKFEIEARQKLQNFSTNDVTLQKR